MTNRKRTKGFQRPLPRAHTLLELVVALVVCGVLVAGLMSTFYVASRATDSSGPARDRQLGCTALKQMLSEMQMALSFTERTATSVEFTVADRDNDLGPETIRYSWSGTPGDPLLRQYNGGTEVAVLDGVEQLSLDYVLKTITETTSQPGEVSGEEVLLASFDGWPGLSESWVSRFYDSSESFVISVPAEATRLTFTRARLRLQQIGGGGGFKSVAIHLPETPGSPEPAATPLGSPGTVNHSDLPVSYWDRWTEITFPDVSIESPGSEYCLVVTGSQPFSGTLLFYQHNSAPADSTVGLWTTDGGATLEPTKAKDLNKNDIPFYIYGYFSTSGGQSVETTRYFVTRVSVGLRAGANAWAQVNGTTHVLSQPEVAAP